MLRDRTEGMIAGSPILIQSGMKGHDMVYLILAHVLEKADNGTKSR